MFFNLESYVSYYDSRSLNLLRYFKHQHISKIKTVYLFLYTLIFSVKMSNMPLHESSEVVRIVYVFLLMFCSARGISYWIGYLLQTLTKSLVLLQVHNGYFKINSLS